MNPQRLKEQEAEILRLWKEYGLVEGDVYRHKQQFIIITRPGIEKIEAKEKIEVTYDVTGFLPDHVAVKCTATKGKVSIQTFGSAKQGGKIPVERGGETKWVSQGNTESWYLTEIAEKRAKARAILQIVGLYKHGFFSEDESDDFKDKNQREEVKMSGNQTEAPKKETAKTSETPKKEAPKAETPKAETPKKEAVEAKGAEIPNKRMVVEKDGKFLVRKSHVAELRPKIGDTINIDGSYYTVVDMNAIDWIMDLGQPPTPTIVESVTEDAEEKMSGIKDGSDRELTETEFEDLKKSCAETGIGMNGINLKNVETRLKAAKSMKELKDAWTEVCVWGFGLNKEAHAIKDQLKEKLNK